MRRALLLMAASAPAYAQGGPEIQWDSWAMSSALVIGLLLALGWGLRRLKLPALGGNRQLRVITSLALGHKEKLVVVQVGEEQWLLGITPQNINRLGKLEQPLEAPQAGKLLTGKRDEVH
ncbi:flagellar biosynthetic protein FliO [Oceanimonas sp. CHS3-5]|uniref:flagellar biosynthetic protein FliO n=1 Tax=Oceanimonas sp. CHS3-5 TaxID=3068186 RepID=UPI00273EB497|nr:flagellar biosynthetic protein FliO [Oceanimonas sp. CHS3-5]MDP5290720.1 flagellar biosynthetic protein FliO [Oceanimonas sp. CHS3-5]